MISKRIDKIQLIQMISTENTVYNHAERTAPPLGLLSIATYISEKSPDIKLELMDASITPKTDIINSIDADLVGVSINLWNYQESLEVAKIAKSKGSIVVVGGHHATSVSENILKNREYIDYVIVGDGERALFELVNNKELHQIENLVYRNHSDIIKNKKCNLNLNYLPVPSRKFVDLEPYYKNYMKALPESPFQSYTTFYSHKGCNWRLRQNGNSCIFCAIETSGYRSRNPHLVWKEISYLKDVYGIKYMMDVGDNLTKGWLKKFHRMKPSANNVAFTGYIRACDIDTEYAELLRNLNFHSIFIGVESGDNSVLKKSRKGICKYDIINAVRLLKDVGIKVRIGIVLGLFGETNFTIGKTINLIDEILKFGVVEGIYSSIMIPLPGSPAFTFLKNNNGYLDQLVKSDFFEPDELRHLWLKNFTKVKFDQLVKYEDKIQQMATPICQ